MTSKRFMHPLLAILAIAMLALGAATISQAGQNPFPVVDTGQTACYGDGHQGAIPCPPEGSRLSGQDGSYSGFQPSYVDNGDGTITDRVTGLVWQKAFIEDVQWEDAEDIARNDRTGGFDDWRVPTIKELYSLIIFSATTGHVDRPGMGPQQNGNGPDRPGPMRNNQNSMMGMGPQQGPGSHPQPGNGPGPGNAPSEAPDDAVPYLDTRFFDFEYPDDPNMRFIDAQYISSTMYTGYTMMRNPTFFGVNFADGRIKGYGITGGPMQRAWYLRLVRGPVGYGENDFMDNGDGTVTDRSSGLTWNQNDSGHASMRGFLDGYYDDGRMDWPEALAYCEDMDFAGYDDWRLPNAKELEYVVDYTRSPQATGTAAMDPIFQVSAITDEAGKRNFPSFWTSTTHLDGPGNGDRAVYVAFGEALGTNPQGTVVIDVHGAGAQRSDPKTGSASRYPEWGHGPQGDVQRVYNYARCVR